MATSRILTIEFKIISHFCDKFPKQPKQPDAWNDPTTGTINKFSAEEKLKTLPKMAMTSYPAMAALLEKCRGCDIPSWDILPKMMMTSYPVIASQLIFPCLQIILSALRPVYEVVFCFKIIHLP